MFFRQFRFELVKMFARKRTYVGFAAFLCMEALILLLVNLPKPKELLRRLIEQNGYGFDDYFSGTTLAMLIIVWTTTLLGSLYLALVAGDLMAKEVEEGTMRMLLCRPVSRMRIVALKYGAAVAYTFALAFFIGLSALAAGIIDRGYGGLFFMAPEQGIFVLLPPARGLSLYFAALPLMGLSMITVSSLGFLFSCFNMKPATASVVTLSALFVDLIFHGIPYFHSLKGYFIADHLPAWMHIFENYPPWWKMAGDCIYLAGLDLTCVIVGGAAFLKRDFK